MVGPIMLKMVKETFREGELLSTFKLGLIRIIPKKGNAHNISDWRPITLLPCGYKIISGVVAKRLEKYLTKIIGRAQKGFVKEKNIGTCTINIINCISNAWERNEGMGIMCVDFSKAFNSVEHAAIKKILEFFNFGNSMIGMVMTLLNDRKARVIMEGGYSSDIDIRRGTPQGDRTSPFLFIIVIEVLLIKIRSMEGRGIDQCRFLPRRIGGVDMEPLTAEAYADDLTIIFKMSANGVELILEILKKFGELTGLVINKAKTQLMICGTDTWDEGNSVHGIKIVSKITILGVTMDRMLNGLSENWENAMIKMRRYCFFWGNFGLSITGRVMVAKTYIMSQVIYLLSVLPLPPQIATEMNDIIINFVKGRDRVLEARRQLLSEELGGYGIIDCKIMDISLKCMWVKRWIEEQIYYDYPMMLATGGERNIADLIGSRSADVIGKPLMRYIIQCWEKFV
jgi:hypothetical protein